MTGAGEKIYKTAIIYSNAAKLLNKSAPNIDMRLILPSQVNAALSLELYFKSLYYFLFQANFSIKGRPSHDFFKLFNKLPPETQKQLDIDFQSILKTRDMRDIEILEKESNVKIPLNLKENIQSWSSVFVSMRYLYEKHKGEKTMVFFPEIENVVKNTIFKIKPELQFT